MNKSFGLITFSIIFLLSGFVTAAAYHDITPEIIDDKVSVCSQRYVNAQHSFSVACFGNWSYYENPSLPPIIENKVVTISPSPSDYIYGKTFIVISVVQGKADELLLDEGLKKLEDEALDRFFEKNHSYQFNKEWSKWIKIGEIDAHQLKFTWMDFETGLMHVYNTQFVIGNDVLIISAYSIDETYQDYFPIFRTITNSIEFLGVSSTVSTPEPVTESAQFTTDSDDPLKQGYEEFDKGNYNDAMSYFYDAALQGNRQGADALNNKGNELSKMGKHTLAISYYDKAIEVSPNYQIPLENKVNSLNDLGIEHLNKNNLDEADSYFNKILEIDPQYVLAWNNKGVISESRGNYAKALQYYDAALEIDPTFQLAKENKKFVQDKLEGNLDISNILFDYYDLIFVGIIGGMVVGGVYLVNKIRKPNKHKPYYPK